MPSIEDLDDDEDFKPIYNDNDHIKKDRGFEPKQEEREKDEEVDEDDWIYSDLFKGTNKKRIKNDSQTPPDSNRWEDRRL